VALVLLGLTATTIPPAVADEPPPVPSLPGVAPVSPAVVGHERSYIGIARSRAGSWVITSPAWLPAQAMTVRVPGTGTPVWGDWDGDGLATPGRYSNGTWSEASHRVGTATLTPVASFGGIAGDIPVTGDIDGDRRTDRGIFRQTGEFHWLLATGQRLRIPFGAAGDAPVVGDWNGDGRDDLAVVRSAQWFLRIPLGTPLPPGLPDRVVVEEVADHRLARFTLGGPADVPLAGDWDGDGVDTPALVRESSRWLTANTWGRLDRLSVTIRRVGAGLIPIAVPSPADAVTGRCPSASPALVRNQAAAAALVVPPRPLSAPTIPSDGPTVDGWALVRDALRDQSRYLVRSDVTGRLSGVRRQPYFDVLATDWRATSYSVRRVGNAAFAVAVARATGALESADDPRDPAAEAPAIAPGVADSYVDWAVRSIACQHRSTSPGGWGAVMQSSLWTYVTAMAAWHSWRRIPPQVRGYVAAMVVAEADEVAYRPIEYWKDRSGAFVGRAGDSRAEDVSWDGMVVALAAAMMPRHERAAAWRTSFVQRSIASYARPADLSDTTPVNGIVPATFLRGTNMLDDGTVINHSTLNPDYMSAIQQNWAAGLTLRAAGQPVPRATVVNGARVYDALRSLSFPTADWPNAAAPGGTIYRSDGSIYFPGTVSWGRARRGIWIATDALARAVKVDTNPAISLRAGNYLWLHARDQRLLQARFADGHTYADGPDEDSYVGGREEYNAQQLAIAYWSRAVTQYVPLAWDSSAYSAEPPLGAG